MKSGVFALATLIALSAQAAPVELSCRPIETKWGEMLFKSMKLKMELPATNASAPGDFKEQAITATFREFDRIVTKVAPFKLRGGVLVGSVLYGEDFGAGNFSLFWDYDAKEVVAVITVSTDGPMTVDVQRCRVTP